MPTPTAARVRPATNPPTVAPTLLNTAHQHKKREHTNTEIHYVHISTDSPIVYHYKGSLPLSGQISVDGGKQGQEGANLWPVEEKDIVLEVVELHDVCI